MVVVLHGVAVSIVGVVLVVVLMSLILVRSFYRVPFIVYSALGLGR